MTALKSWLPALTALIAGVSFVIGALLVSNSVNYVKTLDSSLLTVTGSSQQVITSDRVKWPFSFSRQVRPTS